MSRKTTFVSWIFAGLCVIAPSIASAGPLPVLSLAGHVSYASGEAAPAVMLDRDDTDLPETALFTTDEAALPFLGQDEDRAMTVEIVVETMGYEDRFTIFFPRGTSRLTLPAEDMISMAAEAAAMCDEAEVWLSAGASVTAQLGFDRLSAVQDILLQNQVPGAWIHLDDGSLEAVLERPEIFENGVES